MSAHLVRHGQVRYTDPAGDYAYAMRGQVIEITDEAEAAHLTALAAVVAPGTDIAPPEDPRTWAEILQESADRRYDTVTVP
jgi:hypothetical protein